MPDPLVAAPPLRDVLKRLSAISGVSGYEAPVRAIINELFNPLVDDVSVDVLGNLIAFKQGRQPHDPRRKVMVAVHMDEIGLVVTGLDGAFLRFTHIGGVDYRVLLGQEVLVHGRRSLLGVIASRPPHVVPLAERDKVVPAEQLFVDVGLSAEDLKAQVQVGDIISFRCEPCELMGELMAGKAFDNRASIAALYVALRALVSIDHAWDVYAVATVQEEYSDYIGAITSAFRIRPDLALVIDTTYGNAPDVSEAESFKLGEGPALSVGPNIHPQIYRRLAELASELEIPRQTEPLPGRSGTDGWGIQISRAGIPTGIVSLPVRNLHTPVEIISVKDVQRAGRLTAHFIAGLDEAFLKSLVPDLEAKRLSG